MSESFLNGKVTLLKGDCLELLPTLEENSIDSCVTDPPYHLTSIVKRFGNEAQSHLSVKADKDLGTILAPAYKRLSKGFMGKKWDGGDIAFNPLVWELVFRALKPGAHLLAFSGTRTYHRMACAIEDAGFEIRDQIGWAYGSGFPKSHDVSKAIDRLNGAERKVVGANPNHRAISGVNYEGIYAGGNTGSVHITAPATDSAIQWQGWGTALKPAWEPIVLARKPLSESSIASNVLKHGTGGLNIDGCRIASDGGHKRPFQPTNNGRAIYGEQTGFHPTNAEGRWPANLIHDGSEEVLEGFPETGLSSGGDGSKFRHSNFGMDGPGCITEGGKGFGDTGSAARFFYTAKADSDDRLGSRHPTVKPLDLIQYLIRLITPSGGVVLDPFAGTGTCGEAGWREGFNSILIEREPEYQADIVRRMGLCLAGPDERARETIKASGKVEDAGPLFGGVG